MTSRSATPPAYIALKRRPDDTLRAAIDDMRNLHERIIFFFRSKEIQYHVPEERRDQRTAIIALLSDQTRPTYKRDADQFALLVRAGMPTWDIFNEYGATTFVDVRFVTPLFYLEVSLLYTGDVIDQVDRIKGTLKDIPNVAVRVTYVTKPVDYWKLTWGCVQHQLRIGPHGKNALASILDDLWLGTAVGRWNGTPAQRHEQWTKYGELILSSPLPVGYEPRHDVPL